jgi:hypothetical protein
MKKKTKKNTATCLVFCNRLQDVSYDYLIKADADILGRKRKSKETYKKEYIQ